MIMDAKNIQLDLFALKRLYGLLKKDGDGTCNTATDLLDEHARVLLKNLLDAATKRILKEDSEGSRTISATQLQQSDELSNKPPTPLSKLSITAEGCRSREKKQMESDKDLTFRPQWSRAGVVEQLMQSVLASGLEHTKKRCRLCQRNTINPMEPPIEETHFYDDARNSKIFTDMQRQQNNGSDHDLLNTQHETGSLHDNAKVCTSEVDCLSKEASEAIKHIELCMSALRIRADHSNMFEETKSAGSVDKSHSDESFMSRRNFPFELSSQSVRSLAAEETNQPYWLLNQASSLVRPTKAMSTQSTNNIMSRGPALGIEECKFPTNKVNTTIHGQSVDWIMSRYDFVPSRIHNVQNLSAQLDPSKASYTTPTWPAALSASSKTEGLYQSHKKPSQPLDFHGNVSDAQHKDGTRKNRQYITARRTCLQHQESDGTATDSYSKRTSQQTRSRGSDSDSEEYSLTDQTGDYATTSSTWTESGANGTESNIEDDDIVYSSSSSVADRESISSASSKSEGPSSYDQPIRRHAKSTHSSASKTSGPSRIRKANGKKGKKQTGMWKRMKDKMSIIFHHHHHHHHHHHDDRGNSKTKMSHLGKDINFNRRNEEAYGEKAVEKVKKNQQSHFHGLMEGLLRHVRHSKQSTGKKLVKDQHDRQKTLKKSHWWKVLQRHRRKKLPNKTHVKLGLGKKKARLKALHDMN